MGCMFNSFLLTNISVRMAVEIFMVATEINRLPAATNGVLIISDIAHYIFIPSIGLAPFLKIYSLCNK